MNKEQAKEDLKQIRSANKPGKKFMEEQRWHRELIKKLAETLEDKALTVPELASLTGIPQNDVFWHINVMRKYGQVEIREEVEGYLSYGILNK